MLSLSEQQTLNYLKGYIHNIQADCNHTDWDNVFQIALSQSVEGIIYHHCKSIMPDQIKRKYLGAYLVNSVLSIERQNALSEIAEELEKDKIPVIFMKGAVFRDYYPEPSLRSMGDIDIVIRENDKLAVDDIFRKRLNYERFIDNHSVWTYSKGRIYIEVHNHMFYEQLSNDFDYIGYFSHAFEHIQENSVFAVSSDYFFIPDENYHFLYLMTHTAKHIINNGAGFRAYLDMILMCRNCNLDWKLIKSELQKMNLLEFTETCFALCERWFDVRMPLLSKKLDDSFYEQITEKTFKDGLFGLSNESNIGANTAKEIKRENRGYWITAVRLMLHLLFPPYRDMTLAPWYSFLEGRPYLLPFAWIYRWFYCIVHKLGYSLNRLIEPFTKKDKIKKRENYIKTWGL